MSDLSIPTNQAPPVPDPAPAPQPDNAAFARMRQAQETATAEAKAAKEALAEANARLKSIEDANLSEVERLKRENAELTPIREEYVVSQAALQKIYDAELGTIPDDKRAQVQALSSTGSLADRIDALNAAKSLITTAPQAVGNVTQPTGGNAQAPVARPRTIAELQAMSYSDAFES